MAVTSLHGLKVSYLTYGGEDNNETVMNKRYRYFANLYVRVIFFFHV